MTLTVCLWTGSAAAAGETGDAAGPAPPVPSPRPPAEVLQKGPWQFTGTISPSWGGSPETYSAISQGVFSTRSLSSRVEDLSQHATAVVTSLIKSFQFPKHKTQGEMTKFPFKF